MSSFLLTVFTLSATLATAQAARAAPSPALPADGQVLDPCLESAATTYEMGVCAKAERRRQDRRLFRVVRRLSRMLPHAEQQTFAKAHSQWRRTQRARCRAEASDFQGGSLMPLVYAGCLNEAARVRITDYVARAHALRSPPGPRGP